MLFVCSLVHTHHLSVSVSLSHTQTHTHFTAGLEEAPKKHAGIFFLESFGKGLSYLPVILLADLRVLSIVGLGEGQKDETQGMVSYRMDHRPEPPFAHL